MRRPDGHESAIAEQKKLVSTSAGSSATVTDRQSDLAALLTAVRAGETGAVEQVVALLYRELHLLAQLRLRRAPRSTLLDTTGLLHECYLRLVSVGDLQAADRPQFMAYASRVMRSIIVDTIRRSGAYRHGGDAERVTLATDLPERHAGDAHQILAVSDALDALRAMDEQLVTIVELRYFAGLNNEEIAAALQMSERTVRREWNKARALLYREFNE